MIINVWDSAFLPPLFQGIIGQERKKKAKAKFKFHFLAFCSRFALPKAAIVVFNSRMNHLG